MRSLTTCSAPSRGPWTDLLWGDVIERSKTYAAVLGGTLGFSVLIYVFLILLGDLGMVLGGVLCTGALFAALLCVMLRLDRLEKKLDALISSKEGADRPNE